MELDSGNHAPSYSVIDRPHLAHGAAGSLSLPKAGMHLGQSYFLRSHLSLLPGISPDPRILIV